MTDLAIDMRTIRKSFGKRPVLQGVDLNVPVGKTYAFVGRNGAGKTTAIRMMMGLLPPDSGTLRINGLDPKADALAIRRTVGYLAEDQQMWGWMKVSEIMRFLAPFYPTWNWNLAKNLLDTFSLPSELKIRHMSKGQNVRLGLLLALAHQPRLMILDDPALGLDPIMRKEFLRDVVTYLQGGETPAPGSAGGTHGNPARNALAATPTPPSPSHTSAPMTIFFSSHLLYEIEPVADIIGILNQGRLVCEAPTEKLREEIRQLFFDSALWPQISRDLAHLTPILDIRPDAHRIAAIVQNAPKARAALDGAILEERPLNLDEIFEAFVAGKRLPMSAALAIPVPT